MPKKCDKCGGWEYEVDYIGTRDDNCICHGRNHEEIDIRPICITPQKCRDQEKRIKELEKATEKGYWINVNNENIELKSRVAELEEQIGILRHDYNSGIEVIKTKERMRENSEIRANFLQSKLDKAVKIMNKIDCCAHTDYDDCKKCDTTENCEDMEIKKFISELKQNSSENNSYRN